jgi:hypothetical protein
VAGAAKEAADEAGLFGSAGASPKDVAAAALASLLRCQRRERKAHEDESARHCAVSMV